MELENVSELSCEEREWIERLKTPEYRQEEVVRWAKSVQELRGLVNQVKHFEATLPQGLLAYLEKARHLLAGGVSYVEELKNYDLEVPECEHLKPGTDPFEVAEVAGLSQLHLAVFVLVAGGLGERLGMREPKILLPMELLTGISFVEFYIQLIQAWELYADHSLGVRPEIPLVIMTSEETHEKTAQFLEKHSYFGLKRSQIHYLQQRMVPAFINHDALLSVLRHQGTLKIEEKPHGHGDVHRLLYESGLVEQWNQQGKQWLILFQDTNVLMFHALPVLLGTSFYCGWTMNSLATPRQPKEHVGALCRFVAKPGVHGTSENLPWRKKTLIVNIEYNSLQELWLASGHGDDTPDPLTGYSRFPGNTNVLVFNLPRYAQLLHKSKGIVPEFVNPKYADDSKRLFQCSSRLECLMQSFPYLLEADDRVGVTQLDRWICFSAVKNNLVDAATRAKKGLHPESAFSAEADCYAAHCRYLELAVKSNGGQAEVMAPVMKCFGHLTYPVGPKVVILPSFAFSLHQVKKRLRGVLKLYSNCTLVLEGNVEIENLEVDGALQLRYTCQGGAPLRVRDLKVKNKGFDLVPLDLLDDPTLPLSLLIRGYTLEKKESTDIMA